MSLEPPITKTEWAIIALTALVAVVAGYAFGTAAFS